MSLARGIGERRTTPETPDRTPPDATLVPPGRHDVGRSARRSSRDGRSIESLSGFEEEGPGVGSSNLLSYRCGGFSCRVSGADSGRGAACGRGAASCWFPGCDGGPF